MAGHESLQSHRQPKRGSNRAFGLVMGGFFLLVSLAPVLRHGPPRLWALGLALILLVLAIFAADWLAPLNRIWFRIGMLLHGVVSPLILGLLYFVVLVPYAQVLRWRGHDSLRLRPSEAPSYWVTRTPAGPRAGTMSNQF